MLTRSQVAERLKKSIATVRRYEDRVLFPIIGRNDVRYFDEDAVEELRQNPELAWEWGRSEWFDDNVGASPPRPHRGHRQRDSVEERHADPPRASSPTSDPVDPVSQSERREAVELLEQLVCTVVDAPPRDLVRVGIDETWLDAFVRAVEVLKG